MRESIYSLSEKQYNTIKPLIPLQKPGKGRHRKDDHECINAILYVLKTGCQWKALPKSFELHYSMAFRRLRLWQKKGIWEKIYDKLFETDRISQDREPHPTGGIIDSESSSEKRGGEHIGYDGGKKVKGRKRHILTDTQGRIISFEIKEANIHDSNMVETLLNKASKKKHPKNNMG